MGYDALRKGRVSEIGRAYFITTVSKNREPLFNDLYVARIVIKTMKCLHDENYVNSLSWVLMPDHLHWLFQLSDSRLYEFETSLSIVMKRLKSISAQDINKYLNRDGSVWQKAYYDRGLRDNESLKKTARYIVANPLRAGLVDNILEYSHWDAQWL
ncbi:MAG: transposase [Gammaproteobacteria bacterium]|nr:transposase [Gammaproteobacteria bacterium]